MTKSTDKIESTVEAWESGELGNDETFAALSDLSIDDIEEAAGLKSISIRLKKSLIRDLKLIAKTEGIGYQPLIKGVLTRFADCELKRYAREMLAEKVKPDNTNGDDDKPTKVA